MNSNQIANENDTDQNLSIETVLTEAEQALVKEFFWWASECEVIRVNPPSKLLRLVSEDDENLYWTLVSDPKPHLEFHEPVRFEVTVQRVNRGCNAGTRWVTGGSSADSRLMG